MYETSAAARASDATGLAISETLIKRVRQAPNIQILENHVAIDLITTEKLGLVDQENRCVGAYILDTLTDQAVTIGARFTVLTPLEKERGAKHSPQGSQWDVNLATSNGLKRRQRSFSS